MSSLSINAALKIKKQLISRNLVRSHNECNC